MAKRRNTARDDSFEDKRRRESSRHRRNVNRDERARRRSKERREWYDGDRMSRDKYSSSRHSNRKYNDVVGLFGLFASRVFKI